MLQFHSYKIENVTPQRSPREAPCENVTNLKRRNPLKLSPLQTDVVRNPPFVTFHINETIGMKSSFCNIFDEKKCYIPCFVTKMHYLCKQTVSIRTGGNQKIKKFVCITTMKWQ